MVHSLTPSQYGRITLHSSFFYISWGSFSHDDSAVLHIKRYSWKWEQKQRFCPSVSFTVQQTLNKLCTTKHFSSMLLYWPCPHFEHSKEKLNKGVCGWTARTTTKDTQLSLTWNCQHRAMCSLVIWTRTHAHWVEYAVWTICTHWITRILEIYCNK